MCWHSDGILVWQGGVGKAGIREGEVMCGGREEGEMCGGREEGDVWWEGGGDVLWGRQVSGREECDVA